MSELSEFEVYIKKAGRDTMEFEVHWHMFGKHPEGDEHNELAIQKRQFIVDAIKEKLRTWKGPQHGQS